MSANYLEALLNRVGTRVFVDYYDKFRELSAREVVAVLPREFTLKSRRSRTSKARRIFREGLDGDALRLIADSERVEPVTAVKARELLTGSSGRQS
jgi:hypothetical protein